MKVGHISELGRATQGVKLIRIDERDEIAAITRIDVQDETGTIEEVLNAENGTPDATNGLGTASEVENNEQS